MGNKVFGVVVFVLWASSMSWLLTSKILPSYLQGQAPQSGLRDSSAPIGWRIELAGRPCGQSVVQSVAGVDGVTEIHSRVTLEGVTLDKVAPRWLLSLLQDIGEISLDMRSRSTLDSFGNLATLSSRVRLNDVPAAVKVDGHVAHGKLHLRVQSGEFVKNTEYPWRAGNLMGELAPEPKMIGAHVGQSWRSEVYSPFGSPHSPVEVVEANVVEEEPILHNGKLTPSRRVEYRSIDAAGVSSKNRTRTVVWVAEDGRVLRQDVFFLNTRLRFVRMGDEESLAVAAQSLDLRVYGTLTTPERNSMDRAPIEAGR